jgi:ubiquinol-cytochrome c reductase iron-sulfur subunit
LRILDKGANRTCRVAPRFASQEVGCGEVRSPPFRAFPYAWMSGAVTARADEKTIQRGEGPVTATTTTIHPHEPTRRDFLFIATGAVGAIGAAATAVPLIVQMNPDASTIAAGAPIEVDLAPIVVGQIIKVFWRGKPIFIFHRAPKDIDLARSVNVASLPDPATDQSRVKPGHDQWLVVIGICTHLGCIPLAHEGNYDGWFCPCHGSQYDSSGRIRQGPAPLNLYLPPYQFLTDSKIRIGETAQA